MPRSNPKHRATHYQLGSKVLCRHPGAFKVTTDEWQVTCINCKRLLGHYLPFPDPDL